MNCLEHVWALLDRVIRRCPQQSNSRKDFLQYLRKEWVKIPQAKTAELIGYMPDQVKALKRASWT